MDSPSPSRRQFAAGVVGTALSATAGCLDAASLSNADGGRELAFTLSRDGDSLRDSFVVDLAETRPEFDEAAFQAVLAGERFTTQGHEPFFADPADPVYTRHDGTYYELGSVVVNEVETTHPVLRLSTVSETPTDDRAVTDASTLPEADQRAVKIAYMAARARGNEGGVPWGLVVRGGYAYRDEDALEASVLVGDDGPAFVRYRDTVYAVSVTRERFHEAVYRPTAHAVTDSPERMETILQARFLDARFDREAGSPAVRSVLETAAADGYAESHPYSEGFRAVLKRLDERAYLDGDVSNDALRDDDGRPMLRWGDSYYHYRLRFRETD